MMPKSLLRNKASTSALELVETVKFRRAIDDRQIGDRSTIKRVVLCSGKVFYDLDEARHRDLDEKDWPALVRVEQLHPFPEPELIEILGRYTSAEEIVWCQEEPKNQGAWYQIRHHLQECISEHHRLLYVGRRRSPSPATGYYSVHIAEQEQLVSQALTPGQGQEY
jgi:2-oxoglutarate dehydrogenase E1 component